MRMIKLSDFANVTAGQGAPQDDSAFIKTGGKPFIRAGSLDMLCSGNSENDCEHISDEAAQRHRLKIYPENSILFAKSGMSAKMGRVYRLRKPAYVVSHLAIITPQEKVAEPAYLEHWFRANPPSNLIKDEAYPSIRTSEIEQISVPLPPLDEQKRIAGILDKADAIRRKRAESLKLLDDLLRATFLDMFGDPAVNPKNWPQVNLGEATIIDAPMVDPKLEEYIDLVHIGPDRIERDTGRILPALTAREERLISGKFLFDQRHVLYSKIRPYLRKVALPNFKGLCSADMYPVRPRDNLATREYLFSLLISEAFLDYTKSLPSRASIPKLNREELAAYIFPLPPYELQIEYSKKCAHIKKSYDLCAEAIAESNTLFHSLVARAFSGELSTQTNAEDGNRRYA